MAAILLLVLLMLQEVYLKNWFSFETEDDRRSLYSNRLNTSLYGNYRMSREVDVCLPEIRCDSSHHKYRTIEGVCNNLLHPGWGAVNTAYVRLLLPNYADGIGKPLNLPNARAIKTYALPDFEADDLNHTLATMQWGQVVSHDVTQLVQKSGPPCCEKNGAHVSSAGEWDETCFPLKIPSNDHFYSKFGIKCLEMRRATTAAHMGCPTSGMEHVNFVTHFIDASIVYGSTEKVAKSLRTFRGGFLTTRPNRFGCPFLPNVDKPSKVCPPTNDSDTCYLAGDERVNQNVDMAVMQVLLVRLHNLMALELSKINPEWSDEILYQETRKIVGAIVQHVTYAEYLPVILGGDYADALKLTPLKEGFAQGYNTDLNPSTLTEFIGGPFRAFHTNIQGFLSLFDESRREIGRVPFSDLSNRPGIIQREEFFDHFLRGLATQPQAKMDNFFSSEVSNLLFKSKMGFGKDLISMDIARGRDLGLPSYTTMRKWCGLPPIRRFTDLKDVMELDKITRLSNMYQSVHDVDYFVGGVLERKIPGTLTTPSFRCVMGEAFHRYKHGDRFFYEFSQQEESFTENQLNMIRKFTLSNIICLGSDNINYMQHNAFLPPHPQKNPLKPCGEISKHLHLFDWKMQ